MSAEEDTGEHGHPDPGPDDNAEEGCEAQHQETRICGKNTAGEFEDGDCLAEGIAAFVDGESPEDRENGGNEREVAHGFVLDVVGAGLALEAGDEGIEEEGEEDDGNSD